MTGDLDLEVNIGTLSFLFLLLGVVVVALDNNIESFVRVVLLILRIALDNLDEVPLLNVLVRGTVEVDVVEARVLLLFREVEDKDKGGVLEGDEEENNLGDIDVVEEEEEDVAADVADEAAVLSFCRPLSNSCTKR